MSPVLIATAAAGCAYAGFQWTVRVVVYPQFREVSRPGFAGYAAAHARRITRLVAPLFLALAVTCALLVTTDPREPLAWVCAVCATVVVGATGLGAAPQHRRFGRGWDEAAYARLLRWDTVRVVAATLEAAAALVLVMRS